MTHPRHAALRLLTRLAAVLAAVVAVLLLPAVAFAAPDPDDPAAVSPSSITPATPTDTPAPERSEVAGPATVTPQADPVGPTGPSGPSDDDGASVTVDLGGLTGKPSTSVTVIIAMTLLSLLPAILLTCTSFTKILVVLGLTRNA